MTEPTTDPGPPKERRTCPDCGKTLTVTASGELRQHRCGDTPATTRRKGRQSERDQRRKAVSDLFTVPIAGLGMLGQATEAPALVADAVAIRDGAPPLIDAVVDLAEQHEGLARVVGSLTAAGPWAALMTAALPIALQIAANHSDSLAKTLGLRTADAIVTTEMRKAADEAKAEREWVEAGAS